jgi:hypothetical protein
MEQLYIKLRPYIFISIFTLISSFMVWLPFIQQLSFLGVHIQNTDTGHIYRHYDGLLYVITAKAWYDPRILSQLSIDTPLSPAYYAAHLPLYPGAIRLVALTGLDYVKSMMAVTLLSSLALGWVFYAFIRAFQLTKAPLFLTFVFLMFPRLLVVRSIGAPEPMFMALVIGALWMYERRRFAAAGVIGALAVMAKLPGILLVPAFGLAVLEHIRTTRKIQRTWLFLLLPLGGLLAVCALYAQQYGDFFAYWNSGYVVPMLYPFAAFNMQARWVGTAWLEDVLLYFALYISAAVALGAHHLRSIFYFAAVFVVATTFVQHRDISRYLLPVWPFVCIAFERYLTGKKARLVYLFLIPAVYLYTWNFMQENVMPVSNWAPFF